MAASLELEHESSVTAEVGVIYFQLAERAAEIQSKDDLDDKRAMRRKPKSDLPRP
jgi:hypothetical protein